MQTNLWEKRNMYTIFLLDRNNSPSSLDIMGKYLKLMQTGWIQFDDGPMMVPSGKFNCIVPIHLF
jgi:hypothetical protein